MPEEPMSTVTIPDTLRERVEAAAAERGATIDTLVQEALEEYLEELEDVAEAREIIGRMKLGQSRKIPLSTKRGGLAG
jgi:predicted DNA-binding protein